jgi:GntR family transcriptional regulator, transcriptional repressor for pyruvate dehydrogenase complex
MSAPSIQPIATPRAFEAILHQLKDAVARGALRAGDLLPAERVLAEQFRMSRASERRRCRCSRVVLLSEPRNAFTTVVDLRTWWSSA